MEVRAALMVFDRDSLVGAASEAGSESSAFRFLVALDFLLFSFQADCFFCLVDIHSGWSCGEGIYITPLPFSSLRLCSVQNTCLTPPTVFLTYHMFAVSSSGAFLLAHLSILQSS